jgi:uncharacterized protein YjbI with pentapeptide repeats
MSLALIAIAALGNSVWESTSTSVLAALALILSGILGSLIGFYYGGLRRNYSRISAKDQGRGDLELSRVLQAARILDEPSGISSKVAALQSLALMARSSPRIARTAAEIIAASLRSLSLGDSEPSHIELQVAVNSLSGILQDTGASVQLNLRGLKLENLDLTNAFLRGADLTGSSLARSNISEADFSDATLVNTNLSECFALNASFKYAVLDGANLGAALLIGADFTGALLTRANLSFVSARRADFSRALLAEADFRGADFGDTNFQGALLVEANFEGARFEGARFGGSALSRSQAEQVNVGELGLARPNVVQTDRDLLDWQATRTAAGSPDE